MKAEFRDKKTKSRTKNAQIQIVELYLFARKIVSKRFEYSEPFVWHVVDPCSKREEFDEGGHR